MDKVELLLSLGWEKGNLWANRTFYKLGNMMVFEHNGEIGICDESGKLHYKNLGKLEIRELTKVAMSLKNMYEHPEDFTLKEYMDTIDKKRGFFAVPDDELEVDDLEDLVL